MIPYKRRYGLKSIYDHKLNHEKLYIVKFETEERIYNLYEMLYVFEGTTIGDEIRKLHEEYPGKYRSAFYLLEAICNYMNRTLDDQLLYDDVINDFISNGI